MPHDRTASESRNSRASTRLITALVLAYVFVTPTSGARADEQQEFHCPKPSTVITFGDSGSFTYTGQTGMTCQARTDSGRLVSQFLGLTASGSDLENNHVERLFPLRIGNEIDFTSSGPRVNATGDLVVTTEDIYYDNTVKVVRQEKLVTAAGTFDTFVIEWDQQIKDARSKGAWLTTMWFAPDLGARIKAKFQTLQGYGNDMSNEVTSVTLPHSNAPPTAATSSPSPPEHPPALNIAPAPAPTASAPTTPDSSLSAAARLKTLKDLLDQKLITPDEYAAKRKAILDAL